MNTYKTKNYDVVKIKAGQLLIHEDTNTVVIEFRAGNGWKIGKPQAPERGLNMSRNLQVQMMFSKSQWQRDMYYIGEKEVRLK